MKLVVILQIAVWTIAIINTTETAPVQYEYCGSNYDALNVSLTTDACSEPQCVIRKGNSHDIDVNVISAIKESSPSRIPHTVKVSVSWLPLNIVSANVCGNIQDQPCPIKPDQKISIKLKNIYIPEIIPAFDFKLRVKTYDDRGGVIGCGMLPVIIE